MTTLQERAEQVRATGGCLFVDGMSTQKIEFPADRIFLAEKPNRVVLWLPAAASVTAVSQAVEYLQDLISPPPSKKPTLFGTVLLAPEWQSVLAQAPQDDCSATQRFNGHVRAEALDNQGLLPSADRRQVVILQAPADYTTAEQAVQAYLQSVYRVDDALRIAATAQRIAATAYPAVTPL